MIRHLRTYKNAIHIGGLVFIVAVVLGSAFLVTRYVETNASAQELIASFGYIGAYVIALIGGLSVVLPIAPAGFTPIFTAAGLSIPLIILTLVLGTTTADLLGYYFGNYTKPYTAKKYPKTFEKIKYQKEHNRFYLWLGVFCYIAFLPLPNEAVVIPLAVIGVPLRALLLPLILGTTVHHTLIAFGVGSLFELL